MPSTDVAGGEQSAEERLEVGEPRPAFGQPDQRFPVRLTAMVVCQEAYRDDKGRTHVHAVFENLNVTGFPIQVQFMVWCCARGRGTATLVLKIVDTLETTLAVTEPMLAEVTPFKAHEFFCGFAVGFSGAGLYKVQAFLDGIPAMEVPLMIRLNQPAPPAAR